MKAKSFIVLSLILTSLSSGCSTLSMTSTLMGRQPKENKGLPVVEVMAIWQPGEGKSTKGAPTRGFAGQIMFFAQGSKRPIKVDGDLKVYVFDDVGSVEEQSKPIHIYEFKGGALQGYYNEGKLGPSYQLFLPYTRPGMHEAKCTLRMKYNSELSGDVLSSESTIVLSGKKIAKITDPKPGDHAVSLASKYDAIEHEKMTDSVSSMTKTYKPFLRGGTGIEQASHEEPDVRPRVGAQTRTEPKDEQAHPLKVMTLTPQSSLAPSDTVQTLRATSQSSASDEPAFESHQLAPAETKPAEPARKRTAVSGHPLAEGSSEPAKSDSFDDVFGH